MLLSYVFLDSKVLAASMTNMGLETLEEEEEKARFFAQLEEGASTTIDYSKLNRELDSSSTLGANRRYVNTYALIYSTIDLV